MSLHNITNTFLCFEYRWLPKAMSVSAPIEEQLSPVVQHNHKNVLPTTSPIASSKL